MDILKALLKVTFDGPKEEINKVNKKQPSNSSTSNTCINCVNVVELKSSPNLWCYLTSDDVNENYSCLDFEKSKIN